MTINEAAMFVRNWENFEKFFSQTVLEKAAAKFQVTDFSTFLYVPVNECNYYEQKKYPKLVSKPVNWNYTIYKGAWEQQVTKLSYEYRVPDNYQIHEQDLLKLCLELQYPFIECFDYECYHLDKPFEIYISTPNGTIYCPIEALNNDPQKIVDRMTSYLGWYYGIITEKYAKHMESLNSEPGKLLLDILSGKVLNIDIQRLISQKQDKTNSIKSNPNRYSIVKKVVIEANDKKSCLAILEDTLSVKPRYLIVRDFKYDEQWSEKAESSNIDLAYHALLTLIKEEI